MPSLANTKDEYKKMIASGETGFVTTEEHWHTLLKSGQNPLAHCSEASIDEFTKKLQFRNGGLVSANYEPLMDELTLDQFQKLWQHFGISKELLILIDHHACTGHGNCQGCYSCICTPNC